MDSMAYGVRLREDIHHEALAELRRGKWHMLRGIVTLERAQEAMLHHINSDSAEAPWSDRNFPSISVIVLTCSGRM